MARGVKRRQDGGRVSERDKQQKRSRPLLLWLACMTGVQVLVLTPASAAPWIKFADPDGRFSVMLPFAPEVKSSTTPRAFGDPRPLTLYLVRENANKVWLMVFDTDCSGRGIDAQAALDAQASQLVKGRRVQTSTTLTLDGETGRFLDYTDTDGTRMTAEIFFVGNHLYQIVTRTALTASSQGIKDAEQFSNSLHFAS
jgi:hypothetical protein